VLLRLSAVYRLRAQVSARGALLMHTIRGLACVEPSLAAAVPSE
jgi:hypothetical protein